MWRTFWTDIRSPRRLALLALGTVLAGIGVGLLLASALGASPFDAVLAGVAERVGWTVGATIIVASVAMVAVAWALGTPSGVGTAVTFVGIGMVVDATMAVALLAGDPATLAWPGRVGMWAVGALLLGLGAAMLNACGLGASAYDQFVRAFTRWGLSLHRARLAVDVVAVGAALVVGGAIGWGTLGLLVVIPLLLKFAYPPLARWVAPAPMPVR